jgi:Flp pilus assembly CpaE family ATPase
LTGSPEKVRVVINQVGLNEQPLSVKQAEAIIGREIYWEIPYDRQAMTEVRSSGRPLLEQVPQAAITQNIAHLAETLVGRYAAVAAPLGQRSRNPVSEMRY